jgi:hypothetical protein
MNNTRLQEILIDNFKKEMKEKLGKGVKITICNKWQSEANFTDKGNFWAIVRLVFDYTGWKYKETYPEYSSKPGKPKGITEEMVFRIQMLDYLAVNNGITMVSIAKETGRRDHTSIIDSVKKFENRLETDYYTQKMFLEILTYVKENYYLVKEKSALKSGVIEEY